MAPHRVAGRGWPRWWRPSRDFLSAFEDYRPEAEEFRELDDERILVLVHPSGRGKTSGLELGQMWSKGAVLLHLRGAKVTRELIYFDRERAFADLGLSEQDAQADP